MPSIWNSKCPQGLYQDSETGDTPVKKARNSSDHLFRRFFTGGLHRRNANIPCHIDSHLSRDVRVCGQLPKIPAKLYTVNRVSGFPYKFSYAKHQPSLGQSKEYQKLMSESSGKSRHHDKRASSTSREIKCFDPGSVLSTLLISLHPSSQKAQSNSSWGYESPVYWTEEALEELKLWRDHLSAWNGRAILRTPPHLTIETDASTMGWGACCGNFQTRGLWSKSERLLHRNCLELLAGGFALKSFLRKECSTTSM